MSKVLGLMNMLQESAHSSHYNPVLANDGFDMNESSAFLAVEFNNINRELNERHGVYIDDFAGLLAESYSGRAADFDQLQEGFMSDIGTKIVAGYKRLIEMIKGILAKIQSFLDGMTKSGAALVSKYKNKIVSDRSKFEYEGFDWVSDIKGTLSYVNPCTWLAGKSIGKFAMSALYTGTKPTAYPVNVTNFLDLDTARNNPTEAAKAEEKKYRDELKMLEANTDLNVLKVAYAKDTIKSISLDSYSRLGEALHKVFRGRAEKHTIKGLAAVSFDSVCAVLEKGKDFTEVSDLYDTMKKALEDSLRAVETQISEIEKTRDGSEGRARDLNSLQIDFMKKTVSLSNDLDSVASTINNAALSAAKAKHEECRMIFTKLMSYKPSKKQNNSAVDFLDEAYMEMDNEDLGLLVESAFVLE